MQANIKLKHLKHTIIQLVATVHTAAVVIPPAVVVVTDILTIERLERCALYFYDKLSVIRLGLVPRAHTTYARC